VLIRDGPGSRIRRALRLPWRLKDGPALEGKQKGRGGREIECLDRGLHTYLPIRDATRDGESCLRVRWNPLPRGHATERFTVAEKDLQILKGVGIASP
jgi:hypothetical protein